MSGRRRVALVFDPDRFDHGIRGILGGIPRYVAETRRWQCTLDPRAARHPAGAAAAEEKKL